MLDGFWSRWRKEYLLELREVHHHHRSSGEPQLTGDIVVYSDDQPQSFWRLGRIEKVLQGADGQWWAATVRVSKNGCTSTLNRPIQHLYPLEVVSHNSSVAEPETTQKMSQDQMTQDLNLNGQVSVLHDLKDRLRKELVTRSLRKQFLNGKVKVDFELYDCNYSIVTATFICCEFPSTC